MAEFEITQKGAGNSISRKFASATSRGVALGAKSDDATSAQLAQGTNFIGFVTRDVTTDGPALADHVYPGRLELPFKAGQEVAIEQADEIEAEGGTYLVTSGTGAISGSTAVGSKLSFKDGKLRVKQSADDAYFMLEAQLTPETSGAVRIRARRL